MKEIRNIVSAYHRVDFNEKKAALATVVKVRGSSYRSPGARMLITNDGRWIGSISGGCLEGDALKRAREVMATGIPQVVTYDTREEGSVGIGLGCNGVIDVLIQKVDNDLYSEPMRLFASLMESDNLIVMATIFSGSKNLISKLLCLDAEGKLYGNLAEESLSIKIKNDLLRVRQNRKPEIKLYEGIEVFYEILEPSIDLLIFGAGFDARPVVDMGKAMGWQVTVHGECIAHAAPAKFPLADHVKLCQRDYIDEEIKVKPYSAAVLMSHNYDYDLQVLKRLLKTDVHYIGILGPKKRVSEMFEELEAEGIVLSKADQHRLHSPVGLDIGAETPEEIALSIIGEIQAKFTHRSGGFLKYRNAPIHQRDGDEDQVFRQVFINHQQRKTGA